MKPISFLHKVWKKCNFLQ